MGCNPNSWLPDLPQNIRIGRKSLTLANTLAYYDTARIAAVKGFMVQALADFSQTLQLFQNKLGRLSEALLIG
jgi:hypothetical protein